jgi:hypothetical protein
MSHHVRITRSRGLFHDVARALGLPPDDEKVRPLTKAEWARVVADDRSLVARPNGVVAWTGYPLAEIELTFRDGEILSNKPPPELIEKLGSLAERLDAYVVGEAGEPHALPVAVTALRACGPWGIEEKLVTAPMCAAARCLASTLSSDEEFEAARNRAVRLKGAKARALLALLLAELVNTSDDYLDGGWRTVLAVAALDMSTLPMLVAAAQAPQTAIASVARAALRERTRDDRP